MKTATVALIIQGDEILLGRKQGSPEIGVGTLNGPGGKVELTDESLVDCVIRETREELGIELDPNTLLKVAIITFYAGDEPNMQVHFYRTSYFAGEPCETESMVPEWHTINRIPYDRMLSADSHFLPQLLRGERMCADVYYREKAKDFVRIETFPFVETE